MHPGTPNLEFLRKEARRLQRSVRNERPDALVRVESYLDDLPSEFKLTTAQHVVAHEAGFEDWPQLVRVVHGRHLRERPMSVRRATPDQLRLVTADGRSPEAFSDPYPLRRLPLRTAARQFLDAFIELHRSCCLDGPEYADWRDLRCFDQASRAACELEAAVRAGPDDGSRLTIASRRAIDTYFRLHADDQASDDDDDAYGDFDDALIELGWFFKRFHTRP